ncbi:hypothetical protein HTX81_00740 [Pseudomonas lini]|uniref:hypothetical protein n=1 Tax=Pseudomonas lini TaxID=163011 RepID=UPI000AE61D87|nr:hypothetical protein [Pseudomonas lini]NSX07102.1 hypothetical protein [Pseudomonas lini]
MEDFVAIDDARTIPIEEYLGTIPSEGYRRAETSGLTDFALFFLDLMARNFRVSIEVPPVFVRTTSRVGAEVNPLGFIVVTAGMINHCLDAKWPQAYEILGNKAPAVVGENLVARLGMAWVVGHEFTHMFHFHHEVERRLGNKKSVQRAFEHDADLCATAGIFRLLQHMFGQVMSDTDIRRYASFVLFWIIRSIPDNNNGAGIHPSFSERFFHISLKLAILQENSSEIPDPNARHPRTIARIDAILEAAVACEHAYQQRNGFSGGSYFTEWRKYLSVNGHTSITRDWSKVSPWVQWLSGNQVDMPTSILDQRKIVLEERRAKKLKRKKQSLARVKNRPR